MVASVAAAEAAAVAAGTAGLVVEAAPLILKAAAATGDLAAAAAAVAVREDLALAMEPRLITAAPLAVAARVWAERFSTMAAPSA